MYLLLVNPKAGNQRYRRIERSLINLLDESKIKYKIVLIDDLVNTRDLLKQNITADTEAVVAVGGNGTVNTLIDALTDYANMPLGIVPTSRINHLAKTLGITTWQTGIKLLANHEVRHLRLGRIGERYFAGSLVISPKRNILANILEKRSLLRSFIGVNVKPIPKEEYHVACSLQVDSGLTVRCQINTMAIYFQDEFGKKMKIHLTTLSDKKSQDSIFRANQLNIESSLNMPILCGNETVAHTPIKIQGVGKTLPVLATPTGPPSTKSNKSKKRSWRPSLGMLVSIYIFYDSTTS